MYFVLFLMVEGVFRNISDGMFRIGVGEDFQPTLHLPKEVFPEKHQQTGQHDPSVHFPRLNAIICDRISSGIYALLICF